MTLGAFPLGARPLAAGASETGVTGTLAVTIEDVVMTASGLVGAPVTGTLAVTLEDVVMTASGTVGSSVTGTLAVTLEDVVMAASGTVGSSVTGTLAVTIEDVVMAASGTVGSSVTGTLAVTLEDVVMAASGLVSEPVTGTLAVTLEDVVMAASGFVGVAAGEGTAASLASIQASVEGLGVPGSKQALALVSHSPPATKAINSSQAVALTSVEADAIPACSQTVVMIAYRTGSAENLNNRAWTYSLDGHTFYVLTIGEQGTFVYDQTTGQWCKWKTTGLTSWNMEIGTTWQGSIIAADQSNPIIWKLDPTSFIDDDFKPQERKVTGALSMRQRTFIANYAFRVTASLGVPDVPVTAPATLPEVKLRYSDDVGKTWVDAGDVVITSLDYTQELQWLSLGTMNPPMRIFEVTDTGAVARINGADAEIGQEGE